MLRTQSIKFIFCFCCLFPCFSQQNLTLHDANQIINSALHESHRLSLHPMSIAVLDPGGHLIAFSREDNAGILRFDIAFAKAYGALGMGMSSREILKKATEMPELISGAMNASCGRMIPAPGGVLVVNAQHQIIGAVGASGDSSENDEHIVMVGIKAAGLMVKNS